MVLYHSTIKDRVANILREGLKPLADPIWFASPAPYVMLSDEPWLNLNGDETVVLIVTDPAIRPEDFDEEGLRWPKRILPEFLQVMWT